MIKHVLGFALLGSLLACHKTDPTPVDPTPVAITATYGNAFDLRFGQTATLPEQLPAAVTVRVEDIADTRSTGNVISRFGGKIEVFLRVTPAGAAGQTLKLTQALTSPGADSATVMTETGRYDVRLLHVLPFANYAATPKKDKAIHLRITRR